MPRYAPSGDIRTVRNASTKGSQLTEYQPLTQQNATGGLNLVNSST
jgi:hypothetical protein